MKTAATRCKHRGRAGVSAPALLVLAVSGAPALAVDWYVDVGDPSCAVGTGGPSDPFCSITDAVAAASPGDTIFVAGGTYFESIDLNIDLQIIAPEGPTLTFVDGGSSDQCFRVGAEAMVELEGFKIKSGAGGDGAGIYVAPNSALTLFDCVVTSNYADLAGGGIYVDTNASLTLQECSVLNNGVYYGFGGGGIHAATGAQLTIEDSNLNSNFAETHGGAVRCDGCTMTLVNSTMTGNSAGGYDVGIGGGLYVNDGGTVGFEGCTVSGNAAEGNGITTTTYGGGIAIRNGDVTIANSTIIDNETEKPGRYMWAAGGGIWASEGSLTVTGSVIQSNTGGKGGGIYSDSAVGLTVVNSTISGNAAQSGFYFTVYYSGGGGIDCNGPATITDSTIAGNTASFGGGVSCSGLTTITGCTVEDNSAWSEGGGISAAGDLTLTNSTIRGNLCVDAPYYAARGGGLFVGGTAVIEDSVIELNEVESATFTDGHGAGIHNWGELAVRRCLVRGNISTGVVSGGGISSNDTLALSDTEVSGNFATFAGGVHVESGATTVVRSTLAGNDAAIAGGLMQEGGSVALRSSIVAMNTSEGGGADCDGSVASYGYNLISSTAGCTLSGQTSLDLLDEDPQFLDAANGDYRLSSSSPCIDAGDPASDRCIDVDWRGTPRELDGDLDKTRALDIGGAEFSHVYLGVTGDPTPGGTFEIAVTGTTGMPTLMFAGLGQDAVCHQRYGPFFLDFSSFWLTLPWGTIPSTTQITFDPGVPTPFELVLQLLTTSAGAGNTSNVFAVTVE